MKLTLNGGTTMPALGFGVYQIPPEETFDAVTEALNVGYRLIDTAAAYDNERAVGEAIRASHITRDELFIETKIWISDYGYDKTLHAFEKSATKLGVERIDLLLLHQAMPGAFDETLQAYRALEQLYTEGRIQSIGVSNFMVEHLKTLREHSDILPAVNQIECHPFFTQPQVRALNHQWGIITQAWSPIGGVTEYLGTGTTTFQDQTIGEIAAAQNRSPAQIMLAWHLHEGRSAIPKSVTPSRIAENFEVFDIALTDEQIATLYALDTGKRGGPEPEAVTHETFGKHIPEA